MPLYRRWPKSSRSYAPRGRMAKAKFFSNLAVLFFILVVGGIFLTLAVFTWFARDLPEPDKIVRTEGFSTKIYDRNEKLLYDVYAQQRRTPVEISEIPQYLKEATLAIEDKDFYKHGGFDMKGWIRAFFNIVVYRKLQGGSTLTQQLVKNSLLTQDRTITRKIKEFILSMQIEKKYSKDQILQMYFNETPYGGTAYGAEAASELYFNKKVSELNLVESAILAGLPQRPSVYSPFSATPKEYIGRTEAVLRRMKEDGYITSQQEQEARKEIAKVQFSAKGADFKAPHFVMYVKKLLEDRYGERLVEQGGLKVLTTLDLDLQEKAQTIVSEEIAKVEKVKITNGASMVMDPNNGQILAMVGSKNYDDPNYDGKVNVVMSLRQPGSSIKPVTYVTAFKKGYTPATMLMDTPTVFPGGANQPEYKPLNYDGKFHGPTQIRYALGNSLNIPAVKMLALVGVKETLKTAYDMGFTSLEPTSQNLSRLGLSMTLGGGEVRLFDMVTAYSAFANGGIKMEPISILKVTDKDGKILEEYKPTNPKRVLTEGEAFLITSILSDNQARQITFGERNSLDIPQVAVKTGTTNDKRDNWTVGWSKNLIVGVWVGNNDNSVMKEVASGVSGASPIWRKIILAGMEGRPREDFPIPDSVVSAEIDTISGARAHNAFPSRIEYFIKGTEPTGEDQVHKLLKLCRGQEKLANILDIARGNYDEKEYFVFKEDDPTAGAMGENKWQKGIGEWLATQPDPKYHPPTEYCGSNDQLDIDFENPQDHATVGNNFTIKVKPISNNSIDQIEIQINGETKTTIKSSPWERDFTLNNGTYQIKAIVKDSKGNSVSKEIKIGVNVAWDVTPTTSP